MMYFTFWVYQVSTQLISLYLILFMKLFDILPGNRQVKNKLK
jgi:hypothetical protein